MMPVRETHTSTNLEQTSEHEPFGNEAVMHRPATAARPVAAVFAALCLAVVTCSYGATPAPKFSGLKEINPPKLPPNDAVKAVVGATLIDGRGGPSIANSAIVIRGNTIIAAGPRAGVPIPKDAKIFDATGLALLPGLIDAHLHIGTGPRMYSIPKMYIDHGVTTARDPGRPIEVYDPIRRANTPMPRCFVTGPHFDEAPAAHPLNAIIIKDPEHARSAVKQYVAEGASAIKVYFRLSLDSIRAACEAAHTLNIPVTAHLELVDADEAIEAGLDGIEHITSFGTSLADPDEADRFRAAVDADNAARRDGRYRLWAGFDLARSPRARTLLRLLAQREIFVSPTLTTFELRAGDPKTEEFHVRGFEKMLEFTGMCHAAGATVVIGSHTSGKHAKLGWAFQREMELLVESGMSPAETIKAATWDNARFLGCAERLGSIEVGKVADLLLVEGDPLEDIRAMYNVKRVMLNGTWTRTE